MTYISGNSFTWSAQSTGSFFAANTSATTYTINFTATGNIWPASRYPKTKFGKYQVRCRGCARWAKIVRLDSYGLKVNCTRCLGEQDGFVKW